MSRKLTPSLALLVLGAALLFLAAGQTWVTAHLPAADVTGLHRGGAAVRLTWSDLAGGASALALAALAAGAGLLATKGAGRAAVAAITVVIGLGCLGLAIYAVADRGALALRADAVSRVGLHLARPSAPVATSLSGWPVLGFVAAVLVVVAGTLALRTATGATGLADKYEAPAVAAAAETTTSRAATAHDREVAVWGALDREEDPTGA